MRQALRPQLTLKIMFYAILDVVGMVQFATGAMWLARGQSLLIPDFPSGTFQAITLVVSGLLLMVWAVTRILGELLKRPSEDA